MGKSAEDPEGTDQAINLLRVLRQLLGTDWRENWLDNEGIVSIRRAVLPNYLDRDTETLYQTLSPSLEQALNQLLEAETWETIRQVIKNHSELLNEGVDLVVGKYISQEHEPDVKEALIERLDLLRRCREVGVEAALVERTAGFDFILQKISEAEASGDWYSCIRLCRQALSMFERHENAFLWGMLHGALGNSLFRYPQQDRAENLELAIFHHQKALEAYTRSDFPERWALNQFSLANAYQARIRGERSENLELSIEHYEQALEVYTREAFPNDWAMVLNNLIAVYGLRIRGKKDENQEMAIRYALLALEVLTLEGVPERWAALHTNLAQAYRSRLGGKRGENLELAIQHCQHALKAFARQKFPDGWANTQANLASIYKSHVWGERSENLELAIDHYKQALEIYTRESFPERWADVQNDLADTYRERIIDDRTKNLEQAINCSLQALEVYTLEAFPRGWASTNRTLAILYWSRLTGDRSENLEQAIHCSLRALKVYTRESFPERWAGVQNNLANVYRDRIKGDPSENLEQAISCCERALEVYSREIHLETWAGIHHHLGTNFANRVKGRKAENLKQAIYHYQQALEVRSPDRSPSDYRQTQRDLGNLHFNNNDWEQAHRAYELSIETGRGLFETSYTEAGRRAEVGESSRLYANDAYCLLQLGQAAKALLRLEEGKTRLLAEALALADIDLTLLPNDHRRSLRTARKEVSSLEVEMQLPTDTPARRDDRELAKSLREARAHLNELVQTIRIEHPNFMPRGLNFPDLVALIPPGGALVAPMFTSQGSVVFVLPHGTETLNEEHIISLDEFTNVDLKALLQGPANGRELGGWLGAYSKHPTDTRVWFETIEETCGTLWDVMMAPIHERLTRLGLGRGAQVLLMPQGGVGLLPLHAAWRKVDAIRRAFLDDYTVLYAPSGTALGTSRQRLEEAHRKRPSLLAVVNPTGDLRFTAVEAKLVAGLFEPAQCHSLVEAEASPEAVVRAGTGRSYLHFACHGYYAWLDAMQSGLLLAGKAPLTVANIIATMDLAAARLVTLSACETGITEFTQSPDEYLGLPAAFLHAGAPAVVSSLWAVDDLSTMLLMYRFYQHHLQDDLHPATALQRAQIWLRDLTYSELSKVLESYQHLAADRFSVPDQWVSEAFRKYELSQREQTLSRPNARPFDHPYYWAAFTYSGA